MTTGPRCFAGVVDIFTIASEQTSSAFDETWQRDLEVLARRLAKDYDETADDLEAGAVRDPPCRAFPTNASR